MSTISDKEIMKVISETLGVDDMSSRKSKPLNEAYVLEPKKYDIQTDILSQKAISANIEDFKSAVDIVNEISAKLDSVDRSNL